MAIGRKEKILLADERFDLVWTAGPIRDRGRELACRIDPGRRVVQLSNRLSRGEAVAVMAAMASDFCRRRWQPIAVEVDSQWLAERSRD